MELTSTLPKRVKLEPQADLEPLLPLYCFGQIIGNLASPQEAFALLLTFKAVNKVIWDYLFQITKGDIIICFADIASPHRLWKTSPMYSFRGQLVAEAVTPAHVPTVLQVRRRSEEAPLCHCGWTCRLYPLMDGLHFWGCRDLRLPNPIYHCNFTQPVFKKNIMPESSYTNDPSSLTAAERAKSYRFCVTKYRNLPCACTPTCACWMREISSFCRWYDYPTFPSAVELDWSFDEEGDNDNSNTQ